jgi:hypothetical protein
MGYIVKRTPWVAAALWGGGLVYNKVLSNALFLVFAVRGAAVEEAVASGGSVNTPDLILVGIPILIGGVISVATYVYVLHWYFKTGKELALELGEKYNSGLFMFLGLLFGIPMLYVWYKVSKMASVYIESGSLVKYLFLLILYPIGIFVIQRDINQKTPFGEVEEEPSYDILTRIGFFGMEYWWLLAAAVLYLALFTFMIAVMAPLFSQMPV